MDGLLDSFSSRRERPPALVAVLALLCLVVPGASSGAADEPADPDPTRFEESIEAFERADREEPPEPAGILFLGSSSVRRWDLGASFPDLDAINRGFGGSQLSDVIHYADRVVSPYRPRLVVLYAGDNDINGGKSADRVLADFRTLADQIGRLAPGATLAYLSIKPSIARREQWPEMARANDLIRRACEADDRLIFVDLAGPMLDAERRPKPELFASDGLHLSDLGYELWAAVLRPALETEGRGP